MLWLWGRRAVVASVRHLAGKPQNDEGASMKKKKTKKKKKRMSIIKNITLEIQEYNENI